ncbi:neuronal acetylcholine receptor subunit alpha-7 isoform X2 [Lasioglossum baleicum]|uniref:neuronal acetylcholine receptor subunit alpha-7 isoform X2 n=1 Tax=Lasioglossum baleicum TaxID=434251 RepID=UPI003FCCB96D
MRNSPVENPVITEWDIRREDRFFRGCFSRAAQFRPSIECFQAIKVAIFFLLARNERSPRWKADFHGCRTREKRFSCRDAVFGPRHLSGHVKNPLQLFPGLGDEHEYRLTKHLLDGYDAGVRPAKNSSQPLAVVFGLSLHHIIDVDEKNQILTTNCWVTQVWTDHHLKWNASEFAGIRVIRVPYNRVWRPDTILYNNADPQYSSAVINTNVIVSHTGEVVWLSHGIFRSSCDIDVEFFPFDEQRCVLKWASWTYDGYQLELDKQSEQGDVSNYQANGEFDLVDFSARRNVEYYSCCPEPYPDITYEIRLRRRPMFYVFNLILPCILINGVALLVFYVPSESGEKVTLGISALLSMTVFLMTIRETLPPTEKTPLIKLRAK